MAERAEFGLSTKTLRVAASAIAHIHSLNGLPSPIDESVRRTLKDLGQQYRRGQRQAAGLTEVAMAAVKVAVMQPRRKRYGHVESVAEARSRGKADIAMMLLMRDALLRIGEAADLRWEDLAHEADGSGRLLIKRLKTDREGRGAVAFVSATTMNALRSIRKRRRSGGLALRALLTTDETQNKGGGEGGGSGRQLQRAQRAGGHGAGPRARWNGTHRSYERQALEEPRDARPLHSQRGSGTRRRCQVLRGRLAVLRGNPLPAET